MSSIFFSFCWNNNKAEEEITQVVFFKDRKNSAKSSSLWNVLCVGKVEKVATFKIRTSWEPEIQMEQTSNVN